MLGNVDDIDSYIKKSLGLMGVEIAILAVSSSAVRDLVSSKVKDGIKK
jgi:NADH/NAD ratio-sensing transcriptional regulator Rex